LQLKEELLDLLVRIHPHISRLRPEKNWVGHAEEDLVEKAAKDFVTRPHARLRRRASAPPASGNGTCNSDLAK
jgi:hypothetical protein